MYTPSHFRRHDTAELQALMVASPLAVLITFGDGRLQVSHIPLMFDAGRGEHGTLVGHMAAANPQAKHHDTAIEAVAVFTGPDTYVSPSWYETKRTTHKVVPTWNYVAVYATGRLAFLDAVEHKHAVVSRLTSTHEAGFEKPWSVSDAPEDYVRTQLGAIRGFELHISSLEGKWKLSQNRHAADRAGVMEGLGDREATGAEQIAAAMRSIEPDPTNSGSR